MRGDPGMERVLLEMGVNAGAGEPEIALVSNRKK
jgi:hypothetical protein